MRITNFWPSRSSLSLIIVIHAAIHILSRRPWFSWQTVHFSCIKPHVHAPLSFCFCIGTSIVLFDCTSTSTHDKNVGIDIYDILYMNWISEDRYIFSSFFPIYLDDFYLLFQKCLNLYSMNTCVMQLFIFSLHWPAASKWPICTQ